MQASVTGTVDAGEAYYRAGSGGGGLWQWIRPVRGGPEIIATILFHEPFTGAIGSSLPLVIFAIALFILHGRFEAGALRVHARALAANTAGHRRGSETCFAGLRAT
jgi:hypothetical protein